MDLTARVDALERALHRLGIRLIEEELPDEASIDGGLCTIQGEQVVVISPSAPPWRRAEVLAKALRRLPHHEIWLPPEVRQWVQDEDFLDRPVRLVTSPVERSHMGKHEENDR